MSSTSLVPTNSRSTSVSGVINIPPPPPRPGSAPSMPPSEFAAQFARTLGGIAAGAGAAAGEATASQVLGAAGPEIDRRIHSAIQAVITPLTAKLDELFTSVTTHLTAISAAQAASTSTANEALRRVDAARARPADSVVRDNDMMGFGVLVGGSGGGSGAGGGGGAAGGGGPGGSAGGGGRGGGEGSGSSGGSGGNDALDQAIVLRTQMERLRLAGLGQGGDAVLEKVPVAGSSAMVGLRDKEVWLGGADVLMRLRDLGVGTDRLAREIARGSWDRHVVGSRHLSGSQRVLAQDLLRQIIVACEAPSYALDEAIEPTLVWLVATAFYGSQDGMGIAAIHRNDKVSFEYRRKIHLARFVYSTKSPGDHALLQTLHDGGVSEVPGAVDLVEAVARSEAQPRGGPGGRGMGKGRNPRGRPGGK